MHKSYATPHKRICRQEIPPQNHIQSHPIHPAFKTAHPPFDEAMRKLTVHRILPFERCQEATGLRSHPPATGGNGRAIGASTTPSPRGKFSPSARGVFVAFLLWCHSFFFGKHREVVWLTFLYFLLTLFMPALFIQGVEVFWSQESKYPRISVFKTTLLWSVFLGGGCGMRLHRLALVFLNLRGFGHFPLKFSLFLGW